MADLASLVVKLSAETSQYNASIQKATEQIGSFADKVGDSIRDVAKDLLGLEALKQVFDFSENIVKTLASFETLAHAVGSTTESLSQLSFAAKLQGIDDIAVPLEKMAHSAGKAATGNQELINSFAALGVSALDANGKIKPTDQLFLEIADAISKYNDGLAKTSVVQAIFGRSSAEYIKFLDQGAEAIKKAKQEAIDLHVDVSSSAAKAADDFDSNMVRIGAAFKGVFFQAIEEVLPKFIELTDGIIAFAKGAGNTTPIVEEIAAGFKLIASAAVILGTAFQVLGTLIGEQVARIVQLGDAFLDLADQILHPIDSLKKFGDQAKSTLADVANQILHPIDSLHAFSAQLDVLSDDIVKTFTHPIDAINDLGIAILNSLGLADSAAIGQAKKGATALIDIWGEARDRWGEGEDWGPKKRDLNVIDNAQIKAIESAIEELGKLDDKLKEQVATYGLSGAAATVYDVTLGKLSASVDELNGKSLGQAHLALAQLKKEGKLSKTSIDEIIAAIKSGIPIGEAFKAAIIDEATVLEQLKAGDALAKLDSQLLTMTGHLEEAAQAASDLANRPLKITIQTAQDRLSFSGLDDSQKQIEVASQVNAVRQRAIEIEDALGKKIAEIDAAAVASGDSSLKVAGDEAVARQEALAQLDAMYVRIQALANATGFKSAIEQATALRDAIGRFRLYSEIVPDIDKATEVQNRFNKLLREQKSIDDTLAESEANLTKQSAQGALTDIEYMQKQDDARKQAIDQLEILYQKEKAVSDANPGNQQAFDEYKKLGVQITQLQAQMGQLARTVRNDLTDSLSNAFVDFATGSKSASAALRSFVSDFSREMLQLASKQLFQKLFETTGISSGIDSLFGGASKAASGLAGSTQAATTIATAMTTAATTGGTALGAGVTTGATTGGATLGTAIETAGTTAATAIGTAIETAGSAAAAQMAAAIAGGSASGGAIAATGAAATGTDLNTLADSIPLFAAAAGGGQVPANQLTLVGEKGPELFVSDLGATSAAIATRSGATVPDDLTHSHVVGAHGPEYIRPEVSGFVVPSDTFLQKTSERAASAASSQKVISAATGSAVYEGQLVHVGEQGPELLVSDSAHQTAMSATNGGTRIPQDLGSSQLVGLKGPSYVTPTIGGFVVPTDVIASQIPIRQQVPGASTHAGSDSYTQVINGIATPIGLTETFTTDSQGRTSINENVQAYVGMQLPKGAVTASGGTTVTAQDIVYPPGGLSPNQFIGIYGPEELRQQQIGVTLASYLAEFSSPPPRTAADPIIIGGGGHGGDPERSHPGVFKIPAFADGGPFTGGPMLVGERGPEIIVPGSSGTVIPNSAVQGATSPQRQVSTEQIVAAFNQGSTNAAATIKASFDSGGTASSSALSKSIDKMGITLGIAFALGASQISSAIRTGGATSGVGSGGGGLFGLFGGAGGGANIASTGAAATGTDLNALTDTIAAFAKGGPVPANQLSLVGEDGPELFVSDLGEQTAATLTQTGTTIPDDLVHAHVIGLAGPEYIKPSVSGFVVPSDTFLRALSDRRAAQEPRTPQVGTSGRLPGLAADRVDPNQPASPLDAIRQPASVVDLVPLIVGRLPAFPQGLSAPLPAVGPASPIADFPVLSLPATGRSVTPASALAIPTNIDRQFSAAALDSIPEPPSQPDRIDHEIAGVHAAQTPQRVDAATSAMLLKFEKVVSQERSLEPLDARGYESLLTDRYLQKRQGGGPVTGGTPYLVGEGGPELMVPDSNGTVMNSWNDSQNNRSTVIHQTNNFLIPSQNGKVDRPSQNQIAARVGMASQVAIGRNG